MPEAMNPEILAAAEAPPESVWLDELDISQFLQQWGTARQCANAAGGRISLGGQDYRHGIGTNAVSEVYVDLAGEARDFQAMVGLDDAAAERGRASFEVWVDGELAAHAGPMKPGDQPRHVSVDLYGARQMALYTWDEVDDSQADWANWAGALIRMKPGAQFRPRTVDKPREDLPEIAPFDPEEVRINGPRAVGATPGRPFLHKIAVTGKGALEFEATGLPEGLEMDSSTGIIRGSLAKAGEWTARVRVTAENGSAERDIRILGGQHKLAQTPPMGWNSWNVWAGAVSDEKVREAADWLISTGLAAAGYQYINIDDCWENGRDEAGNILPNEKFPDMKALCDYVHGRGLKIGIYSSPGPKTCGGYEGSYQHEEQDAKSWAAWGFDYVKYDWCSYTEVAGGTEEEHMKRPYLKMRQALDGVGRDIVFSLCQYGMGKPWMWVDDVKGNLWRTTGDMVDHWHSMSTIGFNQDGLEQYSGPGHWNDPDMMVVGKVGWGPNLHETRLTPNEQLTHVTLWSLLAAPLLLGCNLAELDRWTLDLITNPEVLEVNQDSLGQQARRVARDGDAEVWARPLEDGCLAVGLFNRGRKPQTVRAAWSVLGLNGPQTVRDLWRREDLGTFEGGWSGEVAGHSAVMLKVG